MKIVSAHATHVGRVRQNNEDAFYDNDFYGLFAVADGMGGHPAGEIASKIAVGCVAAVYDDALKRDPERALRAAFACAHEAILANARLHPERAGMGTTLAACAVVGENLHVAHAGDSAAVLARGRVGRTLTPPHADGHTLQNCLGVGEGHFRGADYSVERLEVGYVVVLCTDGLTLYLDPVGIARVVSASPENAAEALVAHALAAGGQDNVTVVVVRVLP